jgi:hypothetical protein
VSNSSVLILVIGILLATLLVIAGFLIPVFLTSPGRPRSRPRTRKLADSPASYLIMGVAYLFPPLDFTRSRGSIQHRMARAFQRVDAVDPYAAPRRIGSALLDAGLVDTPTQLPGSELDPEWDPGRSEAVWSPSADVPEILWSSENTEPGLPAAPERRGSPQPSESGPIWADAEPDAEFGSGSPEAGGSRFDRPDHEQSRDEE